MALLEDDEDGPALKEPWRSLTATGIFLAATTMLIVAGTAYGLLLLVANLFPNKEFLAAVRGPKGRL